MLESLLYQRKVDTPSTIPQIFTVKGAAYEEIRRQIEKKNEDLRGDEIKFN